MIICEFCSHRWHGGCRAPWCQCRHAGPEEAAGAAVYRLSLRQTAEAARRYRPVLFTFDPGWIPDPGDAIKWRVRFMVGGTMVDPKNLLRNIGGI